MEWLYCEFFYAVPIFSGAEVERLTHRSFGEWQPGLYWMHLLILDFPLLPSSSANGNVYEIEDTVQWWLYPASPELSIHF